MRTIKRKRILALLVSLCMAASLFVSDFQVSAKEIVSADGETVVLTTPQNVREENGFIVWDEVENAYGYTVRATSSTDTWQGNYYENRVEWSRIIYEQSVEHAFGEYTFEVCAFDETGMNTEFSAPVTISYAPTPTVSTPTNIQSVDDGQGIRWDPVEGAARYNILVYYQDGDNRTLYTSTYETQPSWYYYYLSSGTYWFTVQAMDGDYHVSEWSEPFMIEHTEVTRPRLDTPQNVRLDESGENIVWDEVEGAAYYVAGSQITTTCKQPILENWKSYCSPWSKDAQGFSVIACSKEDIDSSYWSDTLYLEYDPIRDESIVVPTVLQEDGCLRWDAIENARISALRILCNGYPIAEENIMCDAMYDASQYIGNRLPAGSYETELSVIDKQGKYNSKTYPLTINSVPDETVWIPKVYYKFETLLWDYDRLRHDKTSFFWIRLRENDKVIKLDRNWNEFFYGLPDLSNGDYVVDVCVYEYDDKIGRWSEPLKISKHDDALFDEENEFTTDVETPPEGADVPEDDRITSITINPAFNMKHKDEDNVEIDLSKIKVKAKEIYDEEGLKRAEEALGQEISGNKHYNLLDLTLMYNGEDFSNSYEGLVKVVIPIPKGHRDKTFSCYRLTEVDGKMTKELIPGEQTEDSYIIYLEHFSEYALVGVGDENHTHVYSTDWKSNSDSHWKECSCKEKTAESPHIKDNGTVTKEPTKNATGVKTYKCRVCGYVLKTEVIAKLPTDATNTKPLTEKKISKEQKEKNGLVMNEKISLKWTGNALTIAWNKISDADGYDIYAAECGKKDFQKAVMSVDGKQKASASIQKVNGKKISKKITYKVKVCAYRLLNGKKQYIGTSAIMHVAGNQNEKVTNIKNIKLSKKSYTLKKGKTVQIRAKIIKSDKKKSLLSKKHGAELNYTSSDKTIATVTKNGKIKAQKRGTCVIYVRALNGVSKKIKVTVK